LFVSKVDLAKRIRDRAIEHVNYFDPNLKWKRQQKKELIKYKNNTNSKYVFRLKFITDKDYEELGPIDAIEYDRRGFCEILWYFLRRDNILFNIPIFSYGAFMDKINSILFRININAINKCIFFQ
jgi:hypothetical protein